MGRAFKAPRKTDKGQWAKVSALWMAGFRFASSYPLLQPSEHHEATLWSDGHVRNGSGSELIAPAETGH